MEQGPVLDELGVPLAPVSAIAGQTRLAVSMSGSQVLAASSGLVAQAVSHRLTVMRHETHSTAALAPCCKCCLRRD